MSSSITVLHDWFFVTVRIVLFLLVDDYGEYPYATNLRGEKGDGSLEPARLRLMIHTQVTVHRVLLHHDA